MGDELEISKGILYGILYDKGILSTLTVMLGTDIVSSPSKRRHQD